MTGLSRKFLAVSDDTPECVSAMIYAAMRANAVSAGLVVLRCARSPGVAGWIGLDREINQDAIDSARLRAMKHVDQVQARTGLNAELVVSDDEPLDAIRKLVSEDLAIKSLVLASGSGRGGPGPLVSRLAKGRALAARPIAVTVIPGDMTDAELDAMAGLAG